MRAAAAKLDQWSQNPAAPAIVLPAPAAQPAAETILQIDHLRPGTPNPIQRCSGLIDCQKTARRPNR
jgi:hypothetical protein